MKKYRFGFDILGLALFFLIMIPNFIWFAIPAQHDILRVESITPIVDTIASIAQVIMIICLCIFKNKEKEKKQVFIQIYQFVKYRLFSLIIDILLMYAFVELVKIDDMISKIIVQVIVIVLNYVFSKIFVFKK